MSFQKLLGRRSRRRIRRRTAKTRRSSLFLERLEDRRMLAALDLSGGAIDYDGDAVANTLVVELAGDKYRFTDTENITVSGTGEADCSGTGTKVVECTASAVTSIDIDLGDGNDSVTLANLTLSGNLAVTSDAVTLNGPVSSAGSVTITADGGAITDNNAISGPDIAAPEIVLAADTGIGTDTDPLEVDATSLDATNSTSGGVFITDTAGGVAVGLVSAGAGDVTLTAIGGSITEAAGTASDAQADIVAGNMILTATTGIGTDTDPLEIDATSLDVTNSTSGGVFITDTAGGLTLNAATITGAGRITTIADAGQITANGPLVIANSVTHNASFTYKAGNSTSPGDNLTIKNSAVVTLNSATAATLTFEAGDDIFFDSGSIKTEGGGEHSVVLSADLEGAGVDDGHRGSVTQPLLPEIVTAQEPLEAGGNPAELTTLLTALDGSPFAEGNVIQIAGTNADGATITASTLTVARGTIVQDLLDAIDAALTGDKAVNVGIVDGLITVITTATGNVAPDLALAVSIEGVAEPIGGFEVTQDGIDADASVTTTKLDIFGADVNLKIKVAGLLDAESTKGNIVLENEGDVSLGVLNAHSGMIQLTTSGKITDGTGTGAPNLTADGVNLTTSGDSSAIGSVDEPIRTAIGALSATTSDGGIYIADSNVTGMSLYNLLAKEEGLTPNAGGENGDKVLLYDTIIPDDGTTPPQPKEGTFDISVTATGYVLVKTVTAPDAVTIKSGGDILDLNQAEGNIVARSVEFEAAGAIGQLMDPIEASNPIDIISETFRATTTDGDISLKQGLVSTALSVVAGGQGSDILVESSAPTLKIRQITASTQGGQVTIANRAGSLLDDNGPSPNVTGAIVNVTGKAGVGTAGDPLETTSSSLSATATNPPLGGNLPAAIHVVETDGALDAVRAKTNGGVVDITGAGGELLLSFDPGTEQQPVELLQATGGTAVTFENVGGNVNLDEINGGSKDVNITALGQIIGADNNKITGRKLTLISGAEPEPGLSPTSVFWNRTISAGIGSDLTPITTDVAELDATTRTGDIYIREVSQVILSASSNGLSAEGTSNIDVQSQNFGKVDGAANFLLGLVSALGNVTLKANGSILDWNDPRGTTTTPVNIIAETLDIEAFRGIGTPEQSRLPIPVPIPANPLEMSVNTLKNAKVSNSASQPAQKSIVLTNDKALEVKSATSTLPTTATPLTLGIVSITAKGELKLGTVGSESSPFQSVTLATTGTMNDVNDTVDTESDTILLVGHGFETGAEVMYQNGGGSDIGGLEGEKKYFVIKVDNDRIKLAMDDANNGTAIDAIDLTSRGSGAGHTIGGKTVDPEVSFVNIHAGDVTLEGSMIGEPGIPGDSASLADKIETKNAESITATATTGGIYLSNEPLSDPAVDPLPLSSELPSLKLDATATGRGADIDIDTGGNIVLVQAIAEGDEVKLRAGGSITDGNEPAPDDSAPVINIKARTLHLAALQGIGTSGNELEVEVNQVLKADGGEPGTFLFNNGLLVLTEDALQAVGSGTLTFEAGSIAIDNISNDVAKIDIGRGLVLKTRSGNIVFLDSNDTIQTQGTDIIIEARSSADRDEDGSFDNDAVAVLGNLQTNGGDITISADRNITIGLLNAGTGHVAVVSDAGIIVDGNGVGVNVIAGSVALEGDAPNARQAELNETFKIAEAAAASAEAKAKLTSADAFESGSVIVTTAENEARKTLKIAEQEKTDASEHARKLKILVGTLTGVALAADAVSLALGIVDNVAEGTKNAADDVEFIFGTVGLSTVKTVTGISASVAAGVSLANNIALTAAGFKFGDAAGTENEKKAQLFAAQETLDLATATRQAFEEAFSIAEASAEGAVFDSSLAARVRDQAIAARDQLNVLGALSVPFGIDVTGVINVVAGPTDSFLKVEGDTDVALINATGGVTLTSTGAIRDADTGTAPDILASDLTLDAVGGIGTTLDPLETRVATLNATNETSGDIAIDNTVGTPADLDITGILQEGSGDVIISNTGVTATDQGITISGPITAVSAESDVQIVSGSPLTVDADVIAGGSIELEATDSPAVGDDLTVNSGVTVRSINSSVTLRAGDDLVVSSGATIQAFTEIIIEADGDVTIDGTLDAPTVVVGVPNDANDNDTVTITPSMAETTVDAGAGDSDVLNFNADGLPVTIQGNTIMTEGRGTVTFNNFESVNILNASGGGSVTLLLQDAAVASDLVLTGTGPGAGEFDLSDILTSDGVRLPFTFSGVNSFSFLASHENDTITVSPFATAVLPWNVAVEIDGGTGTDRITYNNVAGVDDNTSVSALDLGKGRINSPVVTSGFSSQVVAFTNVEDVTANANPGEDERLTVNLRDTAAPDTANLLFDPDAGDDDLQLVGLFNMVIDTDNYVGLMLNGNGGDDTFNITPGPIPVFVDGGDPIGSTAGDAINFQPTGDFVLEPGPENDSGGFVGLGVQRVSFDHIEDVSVSGGTGSGTILGSNGDDDITIMARDGSTHAGADGIRDFTVSVNNGTEVLFLDAAELKVDALAGDDDVVLRTPAPNNAVWDVNLFLAGGTPAAPTGVGQQGDVFTLETPGTQAVTYSPTGIDTATLEIVTLSSMITIAPFTASVSGLPSSPGGVSQIVYQGLGGDDTLILNGTGVDDHFVIHPTNGGSGSHRSELAPTFHFSGANAITATGGSGGSDTVVVEGTGNRDVIIASAATRMVTVRDSTATAPAVILGTGIDIVTIETQGGDDTILVSPDSTNGGELRFHVNGDVPNASAGDRLVIEDQGLGNTIQHHQGPDQRSGSVIVGGLQPVSYEGIEYVDILPLDDDSSSPTFGGTGSDGLGRIVVFHPDPFSHNNSLFNPTELSDLAEHTARPNINPGGRTDPFGLGFDLNGDVDWYRFLAPKTGTFQFQTLLDAVPALANGQPGLPGDGLLRVDVFQADGTPIVRLPSETDDAVQTIGAKGGERYLLRVQGATADSINVYDINVVDLDLLGPRITDPDGAGPQQAIQITGDPTYNIFDVKPETQGPTPLVDSLTVNIEDAPARFPGYLYDALDAGISEAAGHFIVIGDHNGIIPITDVIVINAPVIEGGTATATIELQFAFPLPDDRYTLTLSDSIADPGGNKLDGESNAQQPQGGPTLPSGNTVAGGDFVARFTVDSRPEIATYLGDGTWYVDLNGNGIFDPDNSDFTHRDIVWKFGTNGDLPVVGDWNGDGYDEIGVLGKRNGVDFFFLDMDRNGAFDLAADAAFEFSMQGAGNGEPISGDWDGDGFDEVGVLKGSSWFIDKTGIDYSTSVTVIAPTSVSTSMKGLPIAGDWDGDGDDNVGTFDKGQFFLDTDDDFGDSDLTVNFPAFDFGGLMPQPIAHDWDQDGDDDIGLFVRRETGNNSGSREAGEWYLDVNTDLSGSGIVDARFEPPPTGQPGVSLVYQDIFYNFGDEREPAALGGLRAAVGNFDPPVSVTATIRQVSPYTNSSNNLDANDDGYENPIDVLMIINAINTDGAGMLPLPARPDYYTDVNGDGYLSPIDVIIVINALNEHLAAEGESSPTFVNLSATVVDTSSAASQLAAPIWYVDALSSSSSSNRDRLPIHAATEAAATGELLDTALLAFPALGENDSRHAARDLVLANSTKELTELDAALDAIAADLATNGGSNLNDQ